MAKVLKLIVMDSQGRYTQAKFDDLYPGCTVLFKSGMVIGDVLDMCMPYLETWVERDVPVPRSSELS
jgi:hypothetical protein